MMPGLGGDTYEIVHPGVGVNGSALNSDAQVFSHSRVKLIDALSSLLKAAAAEGTVRADADADDVLLAVSASVSASRGRDDAARKTERLLALIIDGLRFGANSS